MRECVRGRPGKQIQLPPANRIAPLASEFPALDSLRAESWFGEVSVHARSVLAPSRHARVMRAPVLPRPPAHRRQWLDVRCIRESTSAPERVSSAPDPPSLPRLHSTQSFGFVPAGPMRPRVPDLSASSDHQIPSKTRPVICLQNANSNYAS